MHNSRSGIFDFVAHGAAIDKIVAGSFTASYMSNAKWRKCFRSLAEIDDGATVSDRDIQVIWKFVGGGLTEIRHALPPLNAVTNRYLDSRFWFGPAYYKEIEWIEFPAIGKPYGMEQVPGAFYKQNVVLVKNALQTIGMFQLEDTDLGFRLYGYK